MGLKSQQVGKSWEQEIMEIYYKRGYQPVKIATEIHGTVFDIILIKNAGVMCIEAKHIQGDKLYFKSSGISKKKDELDHFIKHSNTNVYIMVKSDKTGCWWTTWLIAKPFFEKQGYISKKECVPMEINNE